MDNIGSSGTDKSAWTKRKTMKKQLCLSVILSASLSLASRAEQLPAPANSEDAFASVLNKALEEHQPKDVFAEIPECALVDVINVRAWTLLEAENLIKPCMAAISQRYQIPVAAEARVVELTNSKCGHDTWGLALQVPQDTPIASRLVSDMNYSLAARREPGRLLGHKAVLQRPSENFNLPVSLAKKSLDSCILPQVIHSIKSSKDFIKHYGHCITQDKRLEVRDIWTADHRLGLTIFSSAAEPTRALLNGTISVNAQEGPVSILVIGEPVDPPQKTDTPPC